MLQPRPRTTYLLSTLFSAFALAVLLTACASWHASRGDDAASEGRWDDAVESYEKSLESDESRAVRRKLAEAKAEAADQHRGRGETAFQAGDYGRAIREYRRSLRYEDDARTQRLLERAHNSKRLAQAEDAVEAGRKAESAKELARARDAYQRALLLDPRRTDAGQGLARAERGIERAERLAVRAHQAFSNEDLEGALALSKEALTIDAGNDSAASTRDTVLRERKASAAAGRAREAARSRNFPRAVRLMDVALAARRTPERAHRRATYARKAAEVYAREGDEARAAGEWDRALESYREAEGYSQEPREIRRRISGVRYERALERAGEAEDEGDLASALRHYRSANEIRPSASLRRQIADLEAQQGRFLARYEAPRSQRYTVYYRTFRDNRILEEMAERLNSRLMISKDVTLVTSQCGMANAFYQDGVIAVCYELMHEWALQFQRQPQAEQLFSGAFGFVFFHELGHALIDVYDLPITGREEDSVDQLAVLALLESGDHEFGETAIIGAARWFYKNASTRRLTEVAFADEHGLDAQRYYNVLCWMYGHDPHTHRDLVSLGHLPPRRADRCPGEYQQMRDSWDHMLEEYLREPS